MRASFFDLVSVMGAHFSFGFEEYRQMRVSDLLELLARLDKQRKRA